MCNSGCILPRPGYLEAVRDLCTRHGVLLIFDEVITGFRMTTGGAQKHYGVTPDLATFGKAAAGGLPLSIVAGRREIMEMSAGGGVAFGGTFNGNPVSIAAAHATLQELSNGALDQACRAGAALMEGIRRVAGTRGVDLLVCGFPTAFALHFTARKELVEYRDTLDDDTARLSALIERLMDEGVYILPDGRMYVSAAHGEAEVAETLSAFERALV
jgi:glutamate-1-semialdehyde 2,1-aminomutase